MPLKGGFNIKCNQRDKNQPLRWQVAPVHLKCCDSETCSIVSADFIFSLYRKDLRVLDKMVGQSQCRQWCYQRCFHCANGYSILVRKNV